MKASIIISSLGKSGSANSFSHLMKSLNSVQLPHLDEDEYDQHYDWVLLRRLGIELGFVDTAYHEGDSPLLWRSKGLTLQQVTFYNRGRANVSPYLNELPYGLSWTDDQRSVRAKMALHAPPPQSYITDRWDILGLRVVVAYQNNYQNIDSIRISIPPLPLSELGRIQPSIISSQWPNLFGLSASSDTLINSLKPLDLPSRIFEDENSHEVFFLNECGISLYFNEEIDANKNPEFIFSAVKFYKSRDLNSRQYTGELPFGLSFDESPALLEKKIGIPPNKKKDGPITGYARWHLPKFSLQVLYSTVENYISRVMLMTPGYLLE